MSLPNYIVNLEELVEAIVGAFDSPELYQMGHQRSYGMQLEVDTHIQDQKISWIPPRDIAITGVRFGIDDIRNIGYEDTFDLSVNGVVLMENIHLKEMYEYKDFRQPYQAVSGYVVEITYHNKTNIPKVIWFDIDYIEKDIVAKEIKVICKNINDNSILKEIPRLVKPPIEVVLTAPMVDGFKVVSDPEVTVTVDLHSPSSIIVEFLYDEVPPPPPPPPLPDPDIPHDLDWKITMRWQGNCGTDLDLHAYLSNGQHLYYNEKELGTDDDNRAWLDKDYVGHNSSSDREDKPEIITILGKPSDSISIAIHTYGNGSDLTEDVTVDIEKVNSNGVLENKKHYVIPANDLRSDKVELNICDIDLRTDNITDRV